MSGMKMWMWATGVLFALCAVWAVATPLMDAPDEPAQVIHAVAIWNGTLLGDSFPRVTPEPDLGPGVVASGVVTRQRVPRAYDELRHLVDCYMFDRLATAECAPAVGTDATPVDSETYVGTYQPTYYLLVGWPSRLLRPSLAVRAMRLVSAAIGAALLGSGLLSARRADRSGALVIGAALAVTPMALFLIGTVNPSGLEIAAAFATWTGLLELFTGRHPPKTSTLVRVGGAAALFALSRPLSPVFLLVALATTALIASTPARMRSLARERPVRLGALGVAIAFIASAIWVISTRAYDAFTGLSQPGLTTIEAIKTHIDMLGFRARQLVGYFGNVDAPLPDAFVWIWLCAIGVLVAIALWRGTWRQRGVLVGIAGFTILLPLASEATRAHTYGFIWQGRYALPFAIGVPIIAGWIIADGRDAAEITRGSTWELTGRIGMVTAAGLVSVTMVVSHLAFMTRVAVGYPNPLFDYLSDARWHPPVSEWLLLGVTVAASLGYLALLVFHCLDGGRTRAVQSSS